MRLCCSRAENWSKIFHLSHTAPKGTFWGENLEIKNFLQSHLWWNLALSVHPTWITRRFRPFIDSLGVYYTVFRFGPSLTYSPYHGVMLNVWGYFRLSCALFVSWESFLSIAVCPGGRGNVSWWLFVRKCWNLQKKKLEISGKKNFHRFDVLIILKETAPKAVRKASYIWGTRNKYRQRVGNLFFNTSLSFSKREPQKCTNRGILNFHSFLPIVCCVGASVAVNWFCMRATPRVRSVVP